MRYVARCDECEVDYELPLDANRTEINHFHLTQLRLAGRTRPEDYVQIEVVTLPVRAIYDTLPWPELKFCRLCGSMKEVMLAFGLDDEPLCYTCWRWGMRWLHELGCTS